MLILSSLVLLCVVVIHGAEEVSQNLRNLMGLAERIQSSSPLDIHNFMADPALPPPTRYEETALHLLESVLDGSITDEFVNLFNFSTESLLVTYRHLLIRHQYHVPSSSRLIELSNQMVSSLERWDLMFSSFEDSQGDAYLHHLPPIGTHWRSQVVGLMATIRANSSVFCDFQVLKFEPQVFLWSVYRDTYSTHSSAFQTMRNSHLYNTLWVEGLQRSKHFMHFRTRGMLSNPSREFPPFRNERICHVYAWYLLNEVLGVTPSYFLQVIEYGGGSGDLAAAHSDMGFSGTHIVYDMFPMLLMQRYFLRFSGHSVFLLEDENKESLFSLARERKVGPMTLLVSPAHLSTHLLPNRSEKGEALTLLLATYSLTESDLESRRRFMRKIQNIGVIFISGNEDNFGNNNMAFVLSLTQNELLEYQCAFLPGNFQDEFFFIASRKDLFLPLDPGNLFDEVFDESVGRCPVLVRK